MLNLSFFIAKKYTLSKIIGYIAIIALTLGITCILTVASVMNGFYDILDKKLSNIISNVVIFNADSTTFSELIEQKNKNNGMFSDITKVEKILQTQAFFSNNNKIEYLGIQNSPNNNSKENQNGLTISSKYAKKNNLKAGQDITLIFTNNKNKLEFLPIQIKKINEETTSVLNQIGYVSKDDPAFKKIFKSNISFSTNIHINLKDSEEANKFKIFINNIFEKIYGKKLVIYTWKEIFGSILDGISYTKQIMFIILFFMIIVATFNILATIFITIKEKQAEIAIMQTIGATKKFIFNIFISQGILFSTISLVMGVTLSYILCLGLADITKFIEYIFDITLINQDNYLIDYLPTKFEFKDVMYITIFTYLINILFAILPAYRAAKTNPVKLLRYE